MNKLIAASVALLIATAPTFAIAQDVEETTPVVEGEEDVILIGPEAADATELAAGAAGLLGLALLLGGGGGGSSTTTTTTTTVAE